MTSDLTLGVGMLIGWNTVQLGAILSLSAGGCGGVLVGDALKTKGDRDRPSGFSRMKVKGPPPMGTMRVFTGERAG